jgi:hypothetical protein
MSQGIALLLCGIEQENMYPSLKATTNHEYIVVDLEDVESQVNNYLFYVNLRPWVFFLFNSTNY